MAEALDPADLPFRPGVRVLDLPIKFPGSDYRLPVELGAYARAVQAALDVEHAVNPDADAYHAYLTLDNARVPRAVTQRVPGLHVDGFQGARIETPLPVDHSYIAHSTLPTAFYPGPFDVAGLDLRRDNVFHAFDVQAEARGMVPVTYPNYTLLFMDAYAVHAGVLAPDETDRTFLRLSYSVREFDRLGNSHNPAFDYAWTMVERSVHLALQRPA